MREKLYTAPFNTVQKLAEADPTEVAALIGGDYDFAEELVEAAKDYTEALREMTRTNYGDEAPEGEPTGEAEPDAASEAEPAEETPPAANEEHPTPSA
jgi:hypothetical protein